MIEESTGRSGNYLLFPRRQRIQVPVRFFLEKGGRVFFNDDPARWRRCLLFGDEEGRFLTILQFYPVCGRCGGLSRRRCIFPDNGPLHGPAGWFRRIEGGRIKPDENYADDGCPEEQKSPEPRPVRIDRFRSAFFRACRSF